MPSFQGLLALPVLLLAAAPASADPVEDFYRGKTVTLAVGTSPGGDYDLRLRMVGRHIGRHIPGNPTIVVTNMPGGGGLVVANWLANVAPHDGTVVVAVTQNLPVTQATGFDARHPLRRAQISLDRQHHRHAERDQFLVHDRHPHHPGRDAARAGGRRHRQRQRLLPLSARAQSTGRHQVQDRHRLSGRQ